MIFLYISFIFTFAYLLSIAHDKAKPQPPPLHIQVIRIPDHIIFNFSDINNNSLDT